jgi:hypothetical protein
VPAPQAPDREAGRPQGDRDHDVHGRQRPAVSSASPRTGSSMLPARVRPVARRVLSGCRPGDRFLDAAGGGSNVGCGRRSLLILPA